MASRCLLSGISGALALKRRKLRLQVCDLGVTHLLAPPRAAISGCAARVRLSTCAPREPERPGAYSRPPAPRSPSAPHKMWRNKMRTTRRQKAGKRRGPRAVGALNVCAGI